MSGRIVACTDHVASEADGRLVILNLKTGEYCGLNEVGACVWRLIQQPRTFEELTEIVAREYAVGTIQLKADLYLLLDQLERNQLIRQPRS